jgi:hypothetical protein
MNRQKTINCDVPIGYVKRCRRCGRIGQARANFHKTFAARKWCGPYFSISHSKITYYPRIYANAKAAGKTIDEARSLANKSQYIASCYLGKENPLPMLEVPHP